MGYEGKIYDDSKESVDLARNAIYNSEAREILIEKAIENIEYIKDNQNNLNHSTKEFIKAFKDNQLEKSQ